MADEKTDQDARDDYKVSGEQSYELSYLASEPVFFGFVNEIKYLLLFCRCHLVKSDISIFLLMATLRAQCLNILT
jgi:hypothetical protein